MKYHFHIFWGVYIFSSPEPKARANYSDQNLSSVWYCWCCHCGTLFTILAHLSWKLKWAFLITHIPSSICPSVRLSVNFSHFQLLLNNHLANFNQTWHKASLGKGDSQLFKWRATVRSQGFTLKYIRKIFKDPILKNSD